MNQQPSSNREVSSTQPRQPSKNRLFALDLLKAVSITVVVLFHSTFVPPSSFADSAGLLGSLFSPLRFCVPVLLTISFFLLARGLEKYAAQPIWPLLKKRLLRLAIPTLFWFGLMAILELILDSTWLALVKSMLQGVIFTGAYYLLILFQLVPIFPWFRRYWRNLKGVLVTVALQAVVFLSISAAVSGTWDSQILPILREMGRSPFAYWFVYMALGTYFHEKWPQLVQLSSRISAGSKLLLLGITLAMLPVERSLIVSNDSASPFEYVMISCILSVPVAFLCCASLEESQLPPAIRQIVLLLSKYSLGIFCINGILSRFLSNIGHELFSAETFSLSEILAIRLISWSLLLAASLGLSVLLDRAKLGVCVR